MASVPTGTKLGRYEVVKPLASGGMAELLLARTAPTERPLVLKWIRPEQAIDSEFIDAFVSEARRAAQLHHPNIVEVHEVGREDGTHYLAMEYVHGDDLRKLLGRLHERRAKLPVQHILAISGAVASALDHAHNAKDADGQPVLHLGIKPGNVIITADGAVKLADFGIGRAALTEGRTDLLASVSGYLAPEQVTGHGVDRRSDIFLLGILMYELSVGRRLFKAENEFATMASIVAGDITPPTKHRGDLPKELDAIIMKALARAPEDRYQTAQEMQVALDKFATKAGVRGSLTTLAGYTKRLFGVRPEPWLVDEDISEAGSHDFDGAPKGLATPPPEAAHCSLPDYVKTTDDAPIMRVKKQVSRDMPTEQLNLANLKVARDAAGADKSSPVKIPAAPSNGNGNGKAKPPAVPPRAPALPPPIRAKPKTVQIPVTKEEEKTAVLAPVPVVGKEEVTKESMQMPAVDASPDLITPTVVDREIAVMTPTKPLEASQLDDRAPTTPHGLKEINGKSTLEKLKLIEEQTKRRRTSDDGLPTPVSGEIKSRASSEERTDTEVDELTVESTAVANPPPMPAVVPSAMPRDATEHVRPLPMPGDKTITATDTIVADARNRKRLIQVAVGVAAIGLIVLVYVIAFGGDDVEPQPASSEVAATETKSTETKTESKPETKTDETDDPKKRETQPEEYRTSGGPRTPRNSHVTTGDQPTTPDPVDEAAKKAEAEAAAKAEAEAAKQAKVDAAAAAKAEAEAAKKAKAEAAAAAKADAAAAKKAKAEEEALKKAEALAAKKAAAEAKKQEEPFEEPRDPAPPDTEKKTTTAKKTQTKKTTEKKTTVAAKKTTAKTKTTKTTAATKKWDPNALFPK